MAANINLMDLPVHQLQAVRSQIDDEVGELTRSFAHLRAAHAKFVQCGAALCEAKQALVPLTNSLYVSGSVLSDMCRVDVGTGFFLELTTVQAKDYYTRKVAFVRTSLDALEAQISTRHSHKRALMEVLQLKMQNISIQSSRVAVEN